MQSLLRVIPAVNLNRMSCNMRCKSLRRVTRTPLYYSGQGAGQTSSGGLTAINTGAVIPNALPKCASRSH